MESPAASSRSNTRTSVAAGWSLVTPVMLPAGADGSGSIGSARHGGAATDDLTIPDASPQLQASFGFAQLVSRGDEGPSGPARAAAQHHQAPVCGHHGARRLG
jgi:hypothetical protein